MTSATLSLDLDDRWAYQKARGGDEWTTAASYFDLFIPLYLQACEAAEVRSTVFIVGSDAANPEQHAILRSIVDAGHETGNHSYHHEPWMQFNSRESIEKEIIDTETAIQQATGTRPEGWRGPGFCRCEAIFSVLKQRGYLYDASSFPTFLGPIARLFYQATAKPSESQKDQLKGLYGSWVDGLSSLNAYTIPTGHGPLLELPVTTMPIFRVPIHGTYLGFLAKYSTFLAKAYFRMAIVLCKLRKVEPSFLLHPLDFLGSDDVDGLDFFPAMTIPGARKRELMKWALKHLARNFNIMPMGEYAKKHSTSQTRNSFPSTNTNAVGIC